MKNDIFEKLTKGVCTHALEPWRTDQSKRRNKFPGNCRRVILWVYQNHCCHLCQKPLKFLEIKTKRMGKKANSKNKRILNECVVCDKCRNLDVEFDPPANNSDFEGFKLIVYNYMNQIVYQSDDSILNKEFSG